MSNQSEIVDTTRECSQCSHGTAFAFQSDHHIRRKHRNVYAAELFHAIVEPEQFSCTSCDHKAYHRFELYEHWKQAHDPKSENKSFQEELDRYPCEHCRYKSDASLCLAKHHRQCKKVPISPRVYEANKPEYVEVMKWTRDSSEPTKWLQCTQCSYKSTQTYYIRKHVVLRHDGTDETRPFPCGKCSYRAKQRSHLKQHMLTHGAARMRCHQCSYRTKCPMNLRRHMLQHVADDQIEWFECSDCPYRAKRKRTLTMHMLRHVPYEETKWFVCNICSFRTKRKDVLRNHMPRHEAKVDVEFQCSHCSYRTRQQTCFRAHMFKHVTDEEMRKFGCDRCLYRARTKYALDAHVRSHHDPKNDKVELTAADRDDDRSVEFRAAIAANFKKKLFNFGSKIVDL